VIFYLRGGGIERGANTPLQGHENSLILKVGGKRVKL
jgi:hypothetical protein